MRSLKFVLVFGLALSSQEIAFARCPDFENEYDCKQVGGTDNFILKINQDKNEPRNNFTISEREAGSNIIKSEDQFTAVLQKDLTEEAYCASASEYGTPFPALFRKTSNHPFKQTIYIVKSPSEVVLLKYDENQPVALKWDCTSKQSGELSLAAAPASLEPSDLSSNEQPTNKKRLMLDNKEAPRKKASSQKMKEEEIDDDEAPSSSEDTHELEDDNDEVLEVEIEDSSIPAQYRCKFTKNFMSTKDRRIANGKLLKDTRETLKLVRQDISDKLNYKHVQHIESWEKGETGIPDKHIPKLETILGLEEGRFFRNAIQFKKIGPQGVGPGLARWCLKTLGWPENELAKKLVEKQNKYYPYSKPKKSLDRGTFNFLFKIKADSEGKIVARHPGNRSDAIATINGDNIHSNRIRWMREIFLESGIDCPLEAFFAPESALNRN